MPGATAIEQLLADEEAVQARTDSRKAKKQHQKQKKHAQQLNSLSAASTEPSAPNSSENNLSEDLADDLYESSSPFTPAHIPPSVNGGAALLPGSDAPHCLTQQTPLGCLLPPSSSAASASQETLETEAASPAHPPHLSGMSSNQGPTDIRSPTNTPAEVSTGTTEEHACPSLVKPSVVIPAQEQQTVPINKPFLDVALPPMGTDSYSDSEDSLHSMAAGTEARPSADQSIRKLFCCPLTQVNILQTTYPYDVPHQQEGAMLHDRVCLEGASAASAV